MRTGINTQNKINVIKKLNFGKANLVVAIPDPWIDVQTIADLEEIAFEFKDKKKKRLRVATKYPNLTREFLFSKGVFVRRYLPKRLSIIVLFRHSNGKFGDSITFEGEGGKPNCALSFEAVPPNACDRKGLPDTRRL